MIEFFNQKLLMYTHYRFREEQTSFCEVMERFITMMLVLTFILYLFTHFCCEILPPEEVSCIAELIASIEDQHLTFCSVSIQSEQSKLNKYVEMIFHDLKHLSVINHANALVN